MALGLGGSKPKLKNCWPKGWQFFFIFFFFFFFFFLGFLFFKKGDLGANPKQKNGRPKRGPFFFIFFFFFFFLGRIHFFTAGYAGDTLARLGVVFVGGVC